MRKLLSLVLMLGLTVGASANGTSHGAPSSGGSHGSVSHGSSSSGGHWSAPAPRTLPMPHSVPMPAIRPSIPISHQGVFFAPHVGTLGPGTTVVPTRIVPAPRIVTVPVNRFFFVGSPFFLGFNPFFANAFYSPFGFGCGGYGFGGYGYGYPYNFGGYNYPYYGQFPSDYVNTYGNTYSTIYAPSNSEDLETPVDGQPTTIVPHTGTHAERAVANSLEGQIVRLSNREIVLQTAQGIDRTFVINDQTYVSQILVPGDRVTISFDARDGYTPVAQSINRVR